MLSDIKARRAEHGLNPDVVFFTGDLAFSGQKEQYAQVGKWLDEVLDACSLPGQRNRLFIVPGNHDVNRNAIKKPDFVHEQYKAFAKALLDSDEYDEINKFLRDDEHKKWALKKFDDFARFIDEFFADEEIRFSSGKCFSVRLIDKGEHKIVVIGLNSAWLSFEDNEQGRLLVGEQQVCDALEEAQEKYPAASLRIAMVHHPLYWLAEKDIHRIQLHLPDGCNLLLRGHLHCPSFSIQSTPDTHLLEFAAGASLRANYHAYNLVQLNLDTGEGFAIVRLQHPEIGGNWGPDSFTYRNAKEGKITFSLASPKGVTITEA